MEGGANGIQSVRTVTREKEEVFDLQDVSVPGSSTNRYYYEVRGILHMMQEKCFEDCWQRLEKTADTIHVVENARKEAGILFPGE